MPEYLAPGVFVEEIDSGSKPIEGVGTNTCAFVGYAKSGEFNKPLFITSWTDFCRIFGEDENLVIGALAKETKKAPAELLVQRRATRKSLLEFARQTCESLGMSWSTFVDKYDIPLSPSAFVPGTYLAHAVQGYFFNGGGRAYVIRIATDSDYKMVKQVGSSAPAATATLEIGGYTIKALESGSAGNEVEVAFIEAEAPDSFTVKISKGDKTEELGSKEKPLTPGTFAKTKSQFVEISAKAEVKDRPAAGVFNLTGGSEASSGTLPAVPSMHELARVAPDDFIGDESKRTGFSALAELEDVNMITVPDLMAGLFEFKSLNGAEGIETLVMNDKKKQMILNAQAMLVAFCESMGDRMAILDPIPGLTPQEMRDTTLGAPWTCKAGQAAIYYPWIKINDPTRRGKNGERYTMMCPPSGHIAGVWCRVVDTVGVHKAPANEGLYGAMQLEWDVSKREQEILNPNGVNCIRQFPGEGIKVWGARTLATVNNPSWKYVNVRRLFNFLETSMERGLRWAVFEPNDQDLWARVRRNLSSFLWIQWKEGKLFGATPEEAYYVKCDRETNPQAMIDQGRMYVEIGVNPVKPAEFVIIRIGQWSGGNETTEQ